MKVDEFHNILAAKAAYLFLWSRPPILLKQWKLLQLPIPQEICFLSAIWTILIRFLVFSESFSWVSLVYSSADCFLSPTWIDHASIPLIVSSSAADSLLGSVLLESGVQSGVYQSILWFLLWILFSATLGFLHPKKQIWGPVNITVPWMLKNKQMSEMKNGNIRV